MNNTGIPYRIVKKILKHNGFVCVNSRGSHDKWVRGNGEFLIVSSNEVNRMIFRRLCKEHNLKDINGLDYRK